VQIQSAGVNPESATRRRMVKCVFDLQHAPIMWAENKLLEVMEEWKNKLPPCLVPVNGIESQSRHQLPWNAF
jgi:hypothetical protein